MREAREGETAKILSAVFRKPCRIFEEEDLAVTGHPVSF